MKRLLISIAAILVVLTIQAQEAKPFKGYYANDEYNVYMRIDLYSEGFDIPEHELYGPLPGFLAKRHNGFYWVITSAKVVNDKEAEVEFINDYGSEDLEATFTMKNDSTLVLHQGEGSTIKIPVDGKWKKLPNKLEFKKIY